MSGNLFFDEASLAYRGKNVIIGKTVRIRYPELVRLGDNVIIDDFTYISTALECDDYVHISAGAKLIGGGVDPVGGTPEAFGAFIRSEIAKWTKIARDVGARAE